MTRIKRISPDFFLEGNTDTRIERIKKDFFCVPPYANYARDNSRIGENPCHPCAKKIRENPFDPRHPCSKSGAPGEQFYTIISKIPPG